MKKAEVSFPKKQAVVTYDPKATSVPAIIRVVHSTPNMMGPTAPKYGAKVHRTG